MIDTNTVNFAMNKITQTFSAALPTMKNVSASYVHFVVTQQIVYLIGFIAGVVVSLLLWIPLYNKAKEKPDGYSDTDEPWFIIPTIFLAIVFGVCLIGTVFQTMDTVLAITNPEMFTVHSIVHSAKSN